MSEEQMEEMAPEESQVVEDTQPADDYVDSTPEVDSVPEDSGKAELDLTDVFDGGVVESDEPRFHERVSQLGFEVEDNSSAQQAILDSYEQAYNYNRQWQEWYENDQRQRQQERQRYAQELQQMQQQQQMYQQQMYQQQQMQQQQYNQQAQPEPEPEPVEQGWWAPPNLDQEEIQKYRIQKQNRNTGEWYWDWKPNAPRELVTRAEDYVEYHNKWKEDILQKPKEVLPKIIEEEFDKLFADRYGSMIDVYQEQQREQQTINEAAEISKRNADWVYQRDPRTGDFARDYNGQMILTNEGEEAVQYINELRQNGITEPKRLWDLASQLLAGKLAQRKLDQTTQDLQYSRAAQERNMRHLQRGAGYIPNRGGSSAPPENPSPTSQNQNLSAGEKLRQQALTDGLF